MPNDASDAVDREAAWLNTTASDGLPILPASAGGKWPVVQGYMARTPGRRGNQLYVLRRRIREDRFAHVRRQNHYEFELRLYWALSNGTGNAESDQRAFDAAIADVLLRIGGPLLDKTHGGRFLSVAEDPRYVDVNFHDPEQSMVAQVAFRADITYSADDPEFNG